MNALEALKSTRRWMLGLPLRLSGVATNSELAGLSFSFRPGTSDRGIFDAVMTRNEYRLPRRFAPTDVIVDIGAHIGSFAYACLIRGAGKVVCFEPDPANAELTRRHLAPFKDRAEVHCAAVWRSDRAEADLLLTGYAPEGNGQLNTGSGNVIFADDPNCKRVKAVQLDDVLKQAGQRIALLKLDCEGAEFPILFSSRELGRVEKIVGEFHGIAAPSNLASIPESARVTGFEQYSLETLSAFLAQRGFSTRATRSGQSNFGTFFADLNGTRA